VLVGLSIAQAIPTQFECSMRSDAFHILSIPKPGGGHQQHRLPVNKLGTLRVPEDSGEEYEIVCMKGSVKKKDAKTCQDCIAGVMTSYPTKAGLTAVVSNNATQISQISGQGIVEFSQGEMLQLNAAQTLSALAKEVDALYWTSKLTDIFIGSSGETPYNGFLQSGQSGFGSTVEHGWYPGAVASQKINAKAMVNDDTTNVGFVIAFDSLDFGENPQNLAVDIKDSDGISQMPNGYSTTGVPLEQAFDTSGGRLNVESVTKVCPFIIVTDTIDVTLEAPSNIPSSGEVARQLKYVPIQEDSRGYIVEELFPRGLQMKWRAVDLDLLHPVTVDEVNKYYSHPASLTTAKKLIIEKVMSLWSGVDMAVDRCIDIRFDTNKVTKRNWPNSLDESCAPSNTEIRAADFWKDQLCILNSGSTDACGNCEARYRELEGSTVGIEVAARLEYAALCHVYTNPLSDQTAMKLIAGWTSDDCQDSNYCTGQYNTTFRGKCPLGCHQCTRALATQGGRRSLKDDSGKETPVKGPVDRTGQSDHDRGLDYATLANYDADENGKLKPPSNPEKIEKQVDGRRLLESATTHITYTDYSQLSSDQVFNMNGCPCKKSWSFNDQSTTDYCMNPDSDPKGNWCKIDYILDELWSKWSNEPNPCTATSTTYGYCQTNHNTNTQTDVMVSSPETIILRGPNTWYENAGGLPPKFCGMHDELENAAAKLRMDYWYSSQTQLTSVTRDWMCTQKLNGGGSFRRYGDRATCSFRPVLPYCEANVGKLAALGKSNPWDPEQGCYPNAADSTCLEQDYCRIGANEQSSIIDSEFRDDHIAQSKCEDKCRATAKLPLKWRAAGWTDLDWSRTEEARATVMAACSETCEYLEYGRCFDDYSKYFQLRRNSTWGATDADTAAQMNPIEGITKLDTDEMVNLAAANGLLCPNENPLECGTISINALHDIDLEGDVNVTNAYFSRTCEDLEVIVPSSADGADQPLHTYNAYADISTRHSQHMKLGCLAFRQCGMSEVSGCYTKDGYGNNCDDEVSKSYHCNSLNGSEKEKCQDAALKTCKNRDDEDSVLRNTFPIIKQMSTEKARDGVRESIVSFKNLMVSLREFSQMMGVNEADAKLASIGVTRIAQYLEQHCAVLKPNDADDLYDRMSATGKYERCVEKLVYYMRLKINEVLPAKRRTALFDNVKASMAEYGQSGNGRNNVLRLDFCNEKSNVASSGMTTDADSVDEDPEGGTIKCDSATMDHLKTFVTLNQLLKGLLMGPSEQANNVALASGAVFVNTTVDDSEFCISLQQIGGSGIFVESQSDCRTSGSIDVKSSMLLNRIVTIPQSTGGASSDGGNNRRLLNSGDASDSAVALGSCPPGSKAIADVKGERCWNAYQTNQYKEEGEPLEDGECSRAPFNGAIVDISTMTQCQNGMVSTSCDTIDFRLTYYKTGDSDYSSYSTTCITDQPIIVFNLQAITEQSDIILEAIGQVEANVVAVSEKIDAIRSDENTVCMRGESNNTKSALKTLYNTLGHCSST